MMEMASMQQMRQRAASQKYRYVSSEYQYMNNGPRSHHQTNIDNFYQQGTYGPIQTPPHGHQLQEQNIELGFPSQQAQTMDPLLYTSEDFVERQNPLFVVEKRIKAIWLGINTPAAIPGAKFTFNFVFSDDLHSFPSKNLEVHLRVFDITDGIDVQMLAENDLIINASNYPLPVNI